MNEEGNVIRTVKTKPGIKNNKNFVGDPKNTIKRLIAEFFNIYDFRYLKVSRFKI